MKLKNKKTGEIGYLQNDTLVKRLRVLNANNDTVGEYKSLAELNAEWEDVPEEPKEYWFIADNGLILSHMDGGDSWIREFRKEIGNYFETKEEAERAVEKLKAFRRLKNEGMSIYSFHREKRGIDLDFYTLTILAPRDKDSLDLLFGDENERVY